MRARSRQKAGHFCLGADCWRALLRKSLLHPGAGQMDRRRGITRSG